MHLIELFFLLSLAVALGVLFKKPISRSPWLQFMPVVAVLFMVLQLLFTGYLWQLLPAYVVSVLLFTLRLSPISSAIRRKAGPSEAKANKRGLRLIGALSGLLLLAFSAAFLLIFPLYRLPEPSGPYAIGTTELYLNDTSRLELLTEDPNDTRELMVKVWYPAESRGADTETYVEPTIAATFAGQHGFPAFVSSHMPRIKTSRFSRVPMANDEQQYPALLFSHGLRVPVVFYSAFLEELASHGYIIFGLQHTYETAGVVFPGNRVAEYYAEVIPVGNRWDQVWQINQAYMAATDPAVRIQKVYEMNKAMPTSDRVRAWSEDIHFVLDELERIQGQPESPFYKKLNLAKLGGFGHSMGGAAIGQAMLQDTRIKAGANWDGGQWGDLIGSRLERPFLAIDAVRDPASYPFMLMNPITYAEADMPQLSYLQIEGAAHSNFSDMAYLTPLKFLSEAGSIDPDRSVELVNKLTLSFFNAHLRQQEGFQEELKQPEISLALQE